MNRSYNSVGAGDLPKLSNGSKCCDPARPGAGQSASGVKVGLDIPKVARPGGRQGGGLKSAGSAPKAARPGGRQSASKA
jgi:hypothetical protein